MTPDDDFPDVRRALDAAPAPALPPVDVAAIYRAAFDRQARLARRWRRAAGAGLLVAAGLLLVAVLPRLEVRCNNDEFAVRWGSPAPVVVAPVPPPPPSPAPDPRLLAQVKELDARTRELDTLTTELHSLKELLLTLAADVDERDRKQRDALALLVKHLQAFEASAREQFRQTEQTSSALYAAIFDKPRSEGERQ
jgi:hypothetical protein